MPHCRFSRFACVRTHTHTETHAHRERDRSLPLTCALGSSSSDVACSAEVIEGCHNCRTLHPAQCYCWEGCVLYHPVHRQDN